MFLWLTCLTFCPRVCLCECTSKFNGRWSLLCVLTVGCSWTDRNKRPRPTQTTLLLSAYARIHIVWCTISALISLNYLLHQSFSSAISQWPTCLWGSQGQPPAGMLHLISGLLGCLFLRAQRGWCCASCIDTAAAMPLTKSDFRGSVVMSRSKKQKTFRFGTWDTWGGYASVLWFDAAVNSLALLMRQKENVHYAAWHHWSDG